MKLRIRIALFITFLLFGVQAPLAIGAGTCEQLKEEIVALQYAIENSKPQDCRFKENAKGEKITQYCCDVKRNPDSCKKMFDVQAEYNDALARVTIFESLIAIGAAVEGKHNALRNIDPKDIEKALENLDIFELSLNRAQMLSGSLVIYKEDDKEKSIWTDYEGSNLEELTSYLDQACSKKAKHSKFFCETYKTMIKDSEDEDSKKAEGTLETLQGFAEADRRVLNTDIERTYSQYRQYLQVKVNGGKSMSIDQLHASGQIDAIDTLRGLLREWQKNPKSHTKTMKEKIIAASKALQEIDVSYDENVAQNVPGEFSEFARSKLAKELTKLHSASGAFINIEDTRRNLRGVADTLKVDLNSKERLVNEEIAGFVKTNMPSCTESPIACVERACPPIAAAKFRCETAPGYEELDKVGIGGIYEKLAKFKDGKKALASVEGVSKCLNKSLTEIQECFLSSLKMTMAQIPSALEKARKDLANAKKILDHHANSENISELEIQKALAVTHMSNRSCDTSLRKAADLESFCGTNDIDEHSKYFIRFKQEVGEVLISYQKDSVSELNKGKKERNELYTDIRSDFLDSCDDGKIKATTLCNELTDEEFYEENRPPKYVDPIVAKQMGLGKHEGIRYEGGNSSVRNVGMIRAGAQTLVAATTGYLQARIQEDQTRAYINYLDNQYKWNNYYNNWYPGPYYSNMNWGMDYYSTTGLYNFNYEATDTMYYQHVNHNWNQTTMPYSGSPGGFFQPPAVSPSSGQAPTGGYSFSFDV